MDNVSVLFFGYGELGVAAAKSLAQVGSEVVGLVVPSNRSGPDVDLVKSFAAQGGVPLLVQPPRKDIGPFAEQLRLLNPDLILVWSYSMILPSEVISLPRLGCVNVHGGLLPQYRGGHVMQWAIINGDIETGATLHYLDEGIDTGPVIAQSRFPIEWNDDAASVRRKLKATGLHLLKEWWPAIVEGTAPRIAQDESKANYHPLRTPEEGLIDWGERNTRIYNLVRALVRPWPGAFTFLRKQKVTVWRAFPVDGLAGECVPGLVRHLDEDGIRVSTGVGDLMICEVEMNGITAGLETLKHFGVVVGDVFGN